MNCRALVLTIRHFLNRASGRPILPPGIVIGRGVAIGAKAELDYNYGRHITIGAEAIIVSGAQILCHDASSCKRIGATRVAPVTIGKRAFIGARAIVLPGVAIGDDAIVGAGAVVS